MPPTRLKPPGRRVLPAVGLVAAVLLLHGALLGLLPHTTGALVPLAAGPALPPLRVRQLVLAPAVSAQALVPAPSPAPAPEAAPSPPQPLQPAPAPPRSAAARVPAPGTATGEPAASVDPAPAEAADNDNLAGAPGEAVPAGLPAGTQLPTYATRLPPAATLQYAVQRSLGGPGRPRAGLQAQLMWRPDAATYTLSLGLGAVGSASVGVLDMHGIAPERHVETRRGREVRAANFQRLAASSGAGSGRITFSGPRVEHPLLPGVQDRLSWMLQLPGVLAADPALGQPGREVQLQVVGVRGDAALWTFRVQAVQNLQLPAGEVLNAVHLQREGARPYDTDVDVWLDPARHHLPVRFRLQNRAEGPATVFELLQLTF